MFHFTRCCFIRAMYSLADEPVLTGTGYPIRTSTGRGLFAAHRGLSQLITSFLACWYQGIHHVLLVAFLLRYLKFVLCKNRVHRKWSGLAQTQQILMLYLSTCMRMSKSMPRDEPAAADACRFDDRRQNSKVVIYSASDRIRCMVGLIGLEPMTLRLSSACSNQLSYRPAASPSAE
jgi:hypothetical protein